MKRNNRIIVVDWDTDGEDVGLPKKVVIPASIPEEEVADYLSNEYGFCVNAWYDWQK